MVEKPWPVQDVAFSPDGDWLATGRGYRGNTSAPPWGDYGKVDVWRVEGWEKQPSLPASFTAMVRAIAFTPDGKNLVAASDKYIRDAKGSPWGGNVGFVWAIPEGKLVQSLRFDDRFDDHHDVNRGVGHVTSMALSSDGELVGLPRVGGVSVVLQRKTGRCVYELKGNAGNYHSLTFSPKGKSIVSVTHLPPFVRLCDAASGKELANFDLKGGEPTCVRFAPDGKQIAVGVSDGSVRLLAADLSKQLQSLAVSDEKEKVVTIAYAAKADLLAAATMDGVRLFEARSGKQIRSWGKTDWNVRAVALSPDGKLLAVGYGGKHDAKGEFRGGYVNIWDTATGRLVKKLD